MNYLSKVNINTAVNYHWVSLALAEDDDIREYFSYLNVNNGYLMGSDGCRLHIIETDLETGFYNIDMQRVGKEIYYPNVNKIMPKKEEYRLVERKLFQLAHSDQGVYCYLIKQDDLEVAINRRYLDSALLGIKEPIIYIKNAKSLVLIEDKSSSKRAFIMPVKILSNKQEG